MTTSAWCDGFVVALQLIQIGNNSNKNSNSEEYGKVFNFYTDCSCSPNPGPGGAAYFSNDFCIKSKIDIIDHDTTINYCELDGIFMVLKSISQFIDFCNNQSTVHTVQIFQNQAKIWKSLQMHIFSKFKRRSYIFNTSCFGIANGILKKMNFSCPKIVILSLGMLVKLRKTKSTNLKPPPPQM